ncbi:MAG: glutamyl-tRNA reductase [Paenibacillaceae bacterium]
MHILVVGLNYRTAPVEIREQFTLAAEQLPEALKELKETKSIMECVVVSTCNRTEIYAVIDRIHMCNHYILGFIEKWFGVSRGQFSHHLYMYEHQQAIEHLFKVTCSLDSMVIGETQILGQVRDAFLLAQEVKTTGTLFNMLFKQAITLAKRAHSETAIGENPVSISYAAVELGKRIFGSFANKTVMIIGAGKMSELTAKHLHANGAEQILVTNRTHERARELAKKFQGKAVLFEKLHEELEYVDIVISSTGSSEMVLTKEQVQKALLKRKARPLFMIDIAVPRDLDPGIGDLANVFLNDIDDLEAIVESNLSERSQEVVKIEAMICEEILVYEQWIKTLGVSPIIQALQLKSSLIHEETMDSLLKKIPDLDDREVKIIRKLTKSIVNQMLRDPILRIKEISGERHADEALALFTKLFALEEQVAKQKLADELAIQKGNLQKIENEEQPAILSFKGQHLLAGS